MTGFSPIHSHFESNNLLHFTFYSKFQRPIKAVIRNLPVSTPAEDISDGIMNLGFDVISLKYHQSFTCRRNNYSKHFPVPNNLTYDVKVPRDIQTDKPLPICNQGSGVRSPDWSHAVLHLPTIRPCLG
jgi:hypothetical protein